jgi:MFS family permease
VNKALAEQAAIGRTTWELPAMDATAQQKPKRTARARSTDAPSVHGIARTVAASTWGDRGARIGLAARALVYVVLAYLVARIALGALGHATAHKPASGPGVAQAIAAQPGGRVVLAVLAVGLLLYALFSLLDAILHHDDESPSAKRWGDRALSAWGVVVYGVFSGYCFRTATSSSGGKQTSVQSDAQHAQWAARVLRWPAGWFWLGALGAILLIIAFFLVTRAARRSFRPRLEHDRMRPFAWRLTLVLGTVGYLGRAGLFAIVGWFILHAAIENDPEQGQGVDGAVRLFANSAAGPYALWLLAAAVAAYALYMFAEFRYRHV